MTSAAIAELGAASCHYHIGQQTVRAVDEVTLAVGDDELMAVVGPSGSGKSTLLRLIGGLERPTSGSVLLDGVAIARASEAELLRLRREVVGFSFQDLRLLPQLTALENVMVPLMPYMRRAELEERARGLLEELGLAARARHRPGELSGGEQQRVALARALVRRPRLLIADEPTGNLDTKNRDALVELMARLHQDGLAIVIATHDPAVAERCLRRLTLVDGWVAEDTGKHTVIDSGE